MDPLQYLFKWALNNNIDPEGPGALNINFANHFKWAPNNSIDPVGLGPLNLIFANQLNGPPTKIMFLGARNLLI